MNELDFQTALTSSVFYQKPVSRIVCTGLPSGLPVYSVSESLFEPTSAPSLLANWSYPADAPAIQTFANNLFNSGLSFQIQKYSDLGSLNLAQVAEMDRFSAFADSNHIMPFLTVLLKNARLINELLKRIQVRSYC